jgi:excisionase family DNA binding protein
MAPICLSIDDAARSIGIGRTKLYELIKAGDIATLKIGRRTLVRTESLHSLVEVREAA